MRTFAGMEKNKPLPLEPGDYYFNEQGLMVFTEQYLRRRGYCCQNGCRHCPYGFRKGGGEQRTTPPQPSQSSE